MNRVARSVSVALLSGALLGMAGPAHAGGPMALAGAGTASDCAANSIKVSLAGATTGATAYSPATWTFVIGAVNADPCAVGGFPGGASPFQGAFDPAQGGCMKNVLTGDVIGTLYLCLANPRVASPVTRTYDINVCETPTLYCSAPGTVDLAGA